MTPDPVANTPETCVLEVARILMAHRFRGLPVVDGDRKVLGVVTEEDLVTRGGLPVRPGLLARLGAEAVDREPELARLAGIQVRELMTTPAVTIRADALVHEAVPKMAERSLRTLPVVDAAGKLLGVISRLDILLAAGHWSRSANQWNRLDEVGTELSVVGEAVVGRERRVLPGAPLLEVGESIARSGIRRVAVVDESGRLLGVVAGMDLIRALEPERAGLWDYLVRRLSGSEVRQRHPGLSQRVQGQTAAALMTTNVVIARADEPLNTAIVRMAEHGLRELPVVDGAGRFVGFLSRPALLRALGARPRNPGYG